MAALTLLNPPRISLPAFARVLADAGSPARPEAAACYASGLRYGIDPAILLAIFRHESQFATDPNAVTIRAGRNWGALRRGGRAYQIANGFAWYRTWADGADACAALLARYHARGIATIEAAIPIYAPSSDGNKPAAYIAAIRADIGRWQAAERATEDRRYVVVEPRGANVRAGKTRQDSIVRKLARGQVVSIRRFVEDGEAVEGSRRWAELATGGYVWAGLLRPHEEGER